MTRTLLSLAVTAALAGGAMFAPATALAQDDEMAALKTQLAELAAKIERLEQVQAQPPKVAAEAKPAADRVVDTAKDKPRLTFSGDIRYRNETFDVEYVESNRNRDRVRARLNANYRINETVSGMFGIATGGTDPRSSNQTLTDQNSRKDFELDLAYVQWAPNADWRVTAGKQRYPWQRTPSMFFDGDVNPEGVAVNYANGNLFGAVFYDWLAERALSFGNVTTGTNTDSILYGAQVGYRFPLSGAVRLNVAASYFNFDGVQGYNPLFGGSSYGNTTTTGALCARAVGTSPCLLSDFDVIEAYADLSSTFAGRPLRVFVDYAQNTAAEVNPVAGEKLDTALAFGINYGAASSSAGTWEIGVLYQQVEKDALFGQLLDSDFGDGNTDADGFVIRGGYTVAKNWTINATMFFNQLGNDVPQTVTVFDDATASPLDTVAMPGVFDRDYKRLQLDLNFKF